MVEDKLYNPLWCMDNTSKDPFSRCATCKNYGYSLSWRWQDKVGLQHNIKKKTWNYVCVVKPNGETSDTNDNVETKINTKHMKLYTWQVNVHVVFLLVRVVFASSYSLIAHHIAWLKAQVVRVFCLISSMHEVSVTLRLWALHSIQLRTLFILHQSQAVPAALPQPWG